jgi:Uma2 family endonuclease
METTSVIIAPGEPALAIPLPPADLIFEDGIPMESPWHRSQMNLLIDLTHEHFRTLGRTDYYTGGNMFLYFSAEQVKSRTYRGPDYFTVLRVDPSRSREGWVVWEEQGRYPDLIVELLSKSTRQEDLGQKKDLYEQTFRTPEYFCFGPDGEMLGWSLAEGRYRPIAPREHGRMWSEVLQAYLGRWEGWFQDIEALWLRLYDAGGRLVPLPAEEAEIERQRAEAAEQRARQEADQRLAAEQRARQEADQRLAAEQRASSAEERLRQLEAELLRLRGGGES